MVTQPPLPDRNGDFNSRSETAKFNLIKSVTAVPSKRKEV